MEGGPDMQKLPILVLPDGKTSQVSTIAQVYTALQSWDGESAGVFLLRQERGVAPGSLCGLSKTICLSADRFVWIAEIRRKWFQETLAIDQDGDMTTAEQITATSLIDVFAMGMDSESKSP